MPLVPWTDRPAIHQADTGTVSTPSRRQVRMAVRKLISLATHTAWASHRTGATPTSSSAVALTLPHGAPTRANSAGGASHRTGAPPPSSGAVALTLPHVATTRANSAG